MYNTFLSKWTFSAFTFTCFISISLKNMEINMEKLSMKYCVERKKKRREKYNILKTFSEPLS